MNPEKIAKFIYELRTEKEWSQYQLANMIPISRQAVSKWERAETIPDSSTLVKLSEIFNVSINELLKGERLEKNSIKELEETTLNILDESNQKTQINKKIVKIFNTIIFLLIFLFLTYYFINSYNAIKVYTVGGKNTNFDIREGIFITTKRKTYFKLGKIIALNDKNIKRVKAYYQKENYNSIIFEDEDIDKTIMDLYGYGESFPPEDIKYIIKNTYVDILYDNDEVETIHLNFERDFNNYSYLFTRKETGIKKDLQQVMKETTLEDEIKLIIQEKGTKEGESFILEIEDQNDKIQLSYHPEIEQIIIKKNNDILGMILVNNHIYTCQNKEYIKENTCEEKIKNLLNEYLKNIG